MQADKVKIRKRMTAILARLYVKNDLKTKMYSEQFCLVVMFSMSVASRYGYSEVKINFVRIVEATL